PPYPRTDVGSPAPTFSLPCNPLRCGAGGTSSLPIVRVARPAAHRAGPARRATACCRDRLVDDCAVRTRRLRLLARRLGAAMGWAAFGTDTKLTGGTRSSKADDGNHRHLRVLRVRRAARPRGRGGADRPRAAAAADRELHCGRHPGRTV